jgi:hypothetical protein
VFENSAIGRIFGAKWEEVAGGCRRLHKEEIQNFYASSNIIRLIKLRSMRLMGHVACMGVTKNTCKLVVGKPEGKRPLGRPWKRWDDNTRMDLREAGWEGVD